MECLAGIALPTGSPAILLKNKKLMRPRWPKQYCLQLDIALWCKNQNEHSIWDESLLFCNCACSLEYSSLSTLAGLSYHICGKLEVAFKVSNSSQHCTDEAQDPCLTLLRSVLVNVTDTFSIVFAVMPFARSVLLHFPAEIHRTLGVSEIAPQLLQALDVENIAAVQFLKNSQVRVTCKTAEYREDLLEGSTLLFGDVPIPVTAADQPIRSVFVRDLPFEVPDCDVKSAFESFGVVLSVHQCFFRDFPSVANGTRRLVMSFRGSIPSSVSVADFPVRVFHAGQPVICSICHGLGTALFRVFACAASSQVTWPENVRSPGVRPVPVPVLLCLLRLLLFPLLSLFRLCRPPRRLCHHLYPLPLSSLRLCNPFCHPLLSRPLLGLLQCHLSRLTNFLVLKMGRLLCLPIIRKLMPLHHGVLVHVFLLRLIIENLSVLSCQK